MDDLQWESPRSSEGIASLVGRGRFLLAAITGVMALIAYLGIQGTSTTVGGMQTPSTPAGQHAAGDTARTTEVPIKLRTAIDPALWDDTVSQFPSMIRGATLTRIREVGERLTANTSRLGTPLIEFQIDIVESPIEEEYCFRDGRLLLTSGLVSRLKTPGQVAAVLSQMMERVVTAQDPRQAVQPWSRLAVALSASGGYDPRAIVWLIDERARAIARQSPHAAERLGLLRRQSAQAGAEIAAAFPRGVPDTLVK